MEPGGVVTRRLAADLDADVGGSDTLTTSRRA